jgi:Family of unknown function (DUF6152)
MRIRVSPMLGIALLLASGPLLAHHSAAMFDRTKKVTVHGTVMRFQYAQPHSWIDVMTIGPDGKGQLWAFEGGAPIQMKMVGLTPDVLKVGDKITITGHPLRDGRPAAAFLELTLPNGKVYNTKPPGGLPGAPGYVPSPPPSPPPAAPSSPPAAPAAPPPETAPGQTTRSTPAA